jgi:anti-sigma factor RsiW
LREASEWRKFEGEAVMRASAGALARRQQRPPQPFAVRGGSSMQCSDLERYLEAYLDLRLGRSRAAILRRHLAVCPACRMRIEGLRHFERDLQRRFRSMERGQSVWSGLEPDLVQSVAGGDLVLPPRDPTMARLRALPPLMGSTMASLLPSAGGTGAVAEGGLAGGSRRRWGRRLVGIALIAAALGTVATPLHGWIVGRSRPLAPLDAYADFVSGKYRLDYETDSVESLQEWLTQELGTGLRLPPTPNGFELAGSRLHRRGDETTVAVVYHRDGLPALLLIRPGGASDVAASLVLHGDEQPPDEGSGFNHFVWRGQDSAFTLVSALPKPVLVEFAHQISGEPL